jgi:hypothetical protein
MFGGAVADESNDPALVLGDNSFLCTSCALDVLYADIAVSLQVIRALYDYEAQSSQELSFSKGDFFHVIGRENDQDWYEACNPSLPDARGLVPVAFFQALGRTERDSAQSDNGRPPTAKGPDHDSGYSEHAPHPITTAVPITHRSTKSSDIDNKIFANVMYDFEAQRADELGATKGEQIIIIAQSTPEWFVAKPIARLGGPGLIPVSYVEIRYVKTRELVPDALEAVRNAGVPSVEEWKKRAASYKNSSITLGKFEVGGGAGGPQQAVEQGMERMSLQAGTQNAQNGSQVLPPRSAQHPSVVPKTLLVCLSITMLMFLPCSTVPSRTYLNPNSSPPTRQQLSSTRQSEPGFLDTALPRRSIGLSSWLFSKIAGIGNSRDIMKTFTTSRLLF